MIVAYEVYGGKQMSKLIKIFSIILIIFSILISFYGVVHATDINMNLTENVIENENIDETDENAIVDDNLVDDTQVTEYMSTVIPASAVTATVEEGLGLTNILSILLITVGVILILLAIAIIIRLK